jgi:hypothetical protein
MTIIEIRPFRNDWQVYESPGVQPVFSDQKQAIDYAKSRERDYNFARPKKSDPSAPRSQGRTREARSEHTLAKNAQHQSSMSGPGIKSASSMRAE